MLFLALATCYCSDLYREAKKRGIAINASDATRAQIEDLIRHTDTVAEVHNTLRVGRPVELSTAEIASS